MHGPINGLDEKGLVVVIGNDYPLNNSGKLRYLFDHVGIKPVYINNEKEDNNPLTDIIPVQFLSYYLALAKNQDPVLSRYDRKKVLAYVKEESAFQKDK